MNYKSEWFPNSGEMTTATLFIDVFINILFLLYMFVYYKIVDFVFTFYPFKIGVFNMLFHLALCCVSYYLLFNVFSLIKKCLKV